MRALKLNLAVFSTCLEPKGNSICFKGRGWNDALQSTQSTPETAFLRQRRMMWEYVTHTHTHMTLCLWSSAMEYNPTKPCPALPEDEIRILATKDKLPLIGFHQATYRPTYLTKTEPEELEEEEPVHKPCYHKQPRYSYMSIFPCEVYHVQLLVMQ